MTNATFTLDRDTHDELKGMIEDTVAKFCDDNIHLRALCPCSPVAVDEDGRES